MVEIKEEDIGFLNWCKCGEAYNCLIINFYGNTTKQDIEQLKQQILQDHEDAKKYRDLIKGNSILFGDKEWILEQSKQAKKDRQIVESIKSYVDLLQEGDPENEEPEKILDNIDKILEGKK